MSSDEMSINMETKPSAQTLAGTSRHDAEEVLPALEFITGNFFPPFVSLAPKFAKDRNAVERCAEPTV